MTEEVNLSKLEVEYLVLAIESAPNIQQLSQFFLWTQGPMSGLLPHEAIVCIQYSDTGELMHIECLHNQVCSPAALLRLRNPVDGLALRLAHYCRSNRQLPCVVETGRQDPQHPLDRLARELEREQWRHALVHGTQGLRGGDTFFAMLAMAEPPGVRQAQFLALLLPNLHLAFQRVVVNSGGAVRPAGLAMSLTPREVEVLGWVHQGKTNPEIGTILKLSTLTVKNHLHNVYRKLNVNNRVQALTRCHELQLLATSAA